MSEKTGRVLVIEDEAVQRILLERLITEAGHQVQSVGDGESGLKVAREYKPDLILLDIYLPNVSGIEILEKLKGDTRFENTSIVLMSADTSEDTAVLGLKKQASEFIHKPIRPSEFKVKLEIWLERKRNRDELQKLNQKLTVEKQVLSQYFSQDVVEKIVKGDLQNQMVGEKIKATILFFDIRNFTTISESIDPNLVAELLNYIYTDIMDQVFSFSGSVNKIIGDAILSTFGAPVSSGHDAANAIKCALTMQETIDIFNRVKPSYLTDDIKIGIGIATGEIFAGNIGSYRRMEYTVIGDIVNTASRLQNLTKKTDYQIMIDGETYKEITDLVRVKPVRVQGIRGKTKAVDIYVVTGAGQSESDNSDDSKEVTFF